MSFSLGVNTGFAVNRYSEPEEWAKILGKDLGVNNAQFTADLLNLSLPDKIIDEQLERIKSSCAENDVNVKSCFTGAFTRVNHLAHPNESIRNYWIEWFKRYIDLAVYLDCDNIGSHFGIFTAKDNNDPNRRAERRSQNIESWHEVGKYAKRKGLDFISWEPMSISREQGETLEECEKLQKDVNHNSPIPFKICLDVDHGDLSSENPDDTDPYCWLNKFAQDTPIIHLKQSYANKGGHWPFTKEHNDKGIIQPKKIIDILNKKNINNTQLVLELSFRERQPIDDNVISVLKESVDFWRTEVHN